MGDHIVKRIQKIGLSCLTFLLGVGLISGQVSADQYRTYQVGKDLNPGKYTVTSKNERVIFTIQLTTLTLFLQTANARSMAFISQNT